MIKKTLIFASLIFFSTGAWAQLMDSPWPKIHKNIQNSGYTSNVGTAIGNLKWSYQTEKPITSSPVLDNNNRVYFGSADKFVYCLDRNTGDLIWKYQTGDAIEHSSPAIDINGILYIGSVDHKLYAFDTINIDPSNPQPKWTFTTGAGIYGSPTVADDGTIFFGSADGYFYQISPATHVGWANWPLENRYDEIPPKYEWRQDIGIIWTTPTIDMVSDENGDEMLGLIIASTKYKDWSGTDDDLNGLCGYKFSTTHKGYNVYVYEYFSKVLRWIGPRNGPSISGIYGSVVTQPDRTVLIPTESNGLLSGRLCWLPVPKPSPPVWAAVTVPGFPGCYYFPADADKWCLSNIVSGYVKGTPAVIPEGSYFLGHDKTLTRFHPSGSVYLSFATEGNIEASAAVDGNLNTYIGCDGGVFYCFNSNSPSQPLRWRYPVTGNLKKLNGDAAEIISSAAIDNDIKHSIYFGASDGKMYAFYDGASIKVKITTDGTTPLPFVTLSLKDTLTGTEIKVGSTDPTGFYEFYGMPAGQYTITPSKDGYIFTVKGSTSNYAPVTLTNVDNYVEFIAQHSFTLTGKVINTLDGTGLALVSVGLVTRNSLGEVVYLDTSTKTDINGNYTFTNIGYGDSTITPSLAGWSFNPKEVTKSIPLGTPGGATYAMSDISAGQGYQVSGTIVDVSNNAPIAGITVTLTGTPVNKPDITPVIKTTGADGTFSFIGLQNGNYTVTPSSAQWKFSPVSSPAMVSDANVLDIQFKGTKGNYFTFTGKVINSADGNGLPNVTISLVTKNSSGAVVYTDTILTDGSGNYSISNISYGTSTLMPSLDQWGFDPPLASQTIPDGIIGGGTYTIPTFTGTLGFQISGRVVDANNSDSATNGLEGVSMTLTGVLADGTSFTPASKTTDSSGFFSFTGLANGTYKLSPELASYKFDYSVQEILINNANVTNILFHGGQGNKITGLIKASGSQTFNGFSVNLYKDDVTFFSKLFKNHTEPTFVTSAKVSSQGSFIFIVPSGKYILEPSAADYSFSPDSKNLTLGFGDISGVEFTAIAGLSISGRLISALGIPQSGIQVALLSSSSTTGKITKTATDGTYSFTGVTAGSYVVKPVASTFYFSTPPSSTQTVSDQKISGVNFTIISFCSNVLINIPPFGQTGSTVTVVGMNFGLTPDPSGSTSSEVTLPDGTTDNFESGLYFGTDDTNTWVKATVKEWTPVYITAEVPQMYTRLVRAWVVRTDLETCVRVSTSNFFILTNQ